jgi:hypothetical protein
MDVMRRCRRTLVGCAILVTIASGRAFAQTADASMLIEVRDTTNAPIPDVVIFVINETNGMTRRGKTTAQGTLAVDRLRTGSYTITAARDGFKAEALQNIRLLTSVKAIVPITLTPGPHEEQVVVTADGTTLRTGNATVGDVFDSQTLENLPANEREVLTFATHAPGVAPAAPGSRLSTQGNTGVNSGGAREAANNFLLDGVDNNDLFLNRLVINPSLDAVQEFALLQNTYDAEYGRSAGAQVNMVLKSGTRQLAGTAYEFFRHSALDARNPFQPEDAPNPSVQRHQFGGTVGGPLGKRSFYFANVDGVRAREAETRLAHVPTALERTGDFSLSGIVIRDPFTGQPFANGIIPPSRLSAAGVRAANLYPTPNRPAANANFVSSPIAARDAVQVTVKTDHRVWRENPLSVRYSFSRDTRDLPFPVRARNLPGFGVSVLDRGQNLAVGFTQSVSPRVINEVRFGFNTLHRDNAPQSAGTNQFAALGIAGPSLDPVDQGFPTLVVSGYETLGDDPNLPVSRRTRTIHLTDALTFDKGRHHLKTGGEFRSYRSDGFNHLFARGQATFQGVFTGNAVADLLLGFPTVALLADNDNRQALRTWSLNGFLQDNWRVARRLTLNAGVRYEFNAPPYDADNRMRIFDLETRQLLQVGTNGVPRSGLDSDVNNLAPRVGLSWDITGRGRWMLRGGYGIFYDSGTLIENSALYFNPPYFTLQLFVPSAQPLTLDSPFAGRAISPRPSINTMNPRFDTGYAQEGSAGLEHVRGTMTMGVRYVTAHGNALVRKRNLNQPTPGPGTLDSRRAIPGFADILLVESQASSSYHALQATATRRPVRGISFRAAYTLAKSMDDTSAFLATDGDDNTPQNSRNLAAEWGPSDFDVRQRLVLSATYEVPSTARRAARHWQISGVFTAQSGRPFTPRVSFDNSNTGNVGGGTFAYDRPNVVATPAIDGSYVTYQGKIFAIAPPFSFGNAGRNSLTGPGYVTLDAMIARRITIAGRRSMQLRLEGFNLLNRRNYQLPDSFVDHVTFGQSLAAYPPRQLQLGARFAF